MLQVEKRHVFGGGTMETKYVIYDTEKRKTVSKEFPNKKTADKALARLLCGAVVIACQRT